MISYDEQGHVLIDGLSADALAEQFGTPLYVYSADGFTSYFNAFQKAVSAVDASTHYAVKANSSLGILQILAAEGAGADIVSAGEMIRALKAGIEASDIVFSGVGKSDAELRFALDNGIGQINAESKAELERIGFIAAEMGVVAPVALRVNVDVDAKSHEKISTGQKDTKFGISVADGQAEQLYHWLCEHPHLRACGLAVHIGSQLTSLEPFEMAYKELLAVADRLREAGYDVPVLDLGGGLGVDYHNFSHPDFARYGEMVTRIFGNRGYKLGFEPGRSIAADNGVLLTRILYTKAGEDKRFVIVDGAMNDLIRPTLYEAYHHIEPTRPASKHDQPADIVGPVCETGDYLGRGRELADVGRGDVLMVRSAGAYGAVMMSNYNTRPEAAEILIRAGRAEILRPRRTVEDLLKAENMLSG